MIWKVCFTNLGADEDRSVVKRGKYKTEHTECEETWSRLLRSLWLGLRSLGGSGSRAGSDSASV
jgi:hypothetical protein